MDDPEAFFEDGGWSFLVSTTANQFAKTSHYPIDGINVIVMRALSSLNNNPWFLTLSPQDPQSGDEDEDDDEDSEDDEFKVQEDSEFGEEEESDVSVAKMVLFWIAAGQWMLWGKDDLCPTWLRIWYQVSHRTAQ